MVVASAGCEITSCAGWACAVEAASSSARVQVRIFIGLLPRRVYSAPRAEGNRRALEDDETAPEFSGRERPEGLVGTAPRGRAPRPGAGRLARREPKLSWTPPWHERPRSAVTNAGIEPAVEKIDGEVDHHEEGRDEQDGALGQRVVALIDGPEDEAADTGKREYLLHHHGAAEEDPHLEPGHGDDGDECVAQGVLEDDGAGGEPLGGGRADVLGAEHAEHAGV